MSYAKQSSSSTSGTPPQVRAAPTIDLRVADATWECRQLQARVQLARRHLDHLESRPSQAAGELQIQLGHTILGAQNKVALEKADARLAVAALQAEVELECRRRVEVARDEARALLVVAESLRSGDRGLASGASSSRADHERVAAGIHDVRAVPR